MNFKIDILVNWEGEEEEFEQFVADLGATVIQHGLGNASDLESEDMKSLLLVNTLDFESEAEIEEWFQEQIDKGAYAALPIHDSDN